MIRTQAALQAAISEALLHASVHLDADLVHALDTMHAETERELQAVQHDDERYAPYAASLEVLDMIRENLHIAEETGLPMCQDTGMIIAFVSIGPDAPFSMHDLQQAIMAGASDAVQRGFFRKSVVTDPVFERRNTETNLPPIIHWFPSERSGVTIQFMLKGFGSENCSSLTMLNPTAGEQAVVRTVVQRVREAGGKPCPPIVVGVGLGGTAERASQLAKLALFRPVGAAHPEPQYEQLERRIEEAVQELSIGPGGFGGPLTALGVSVEYEPTHIAGLPVAVAISCWADRRAVVKIAGVNHA
jgi:fumarate hydratase subunit alpha